MLNVSWLLWSMYENTFTRNVSNRRSDVFISTSTTYIWFVPNNQRTHFSQEMCHTSGNTWSCFYSYLTKIYGWVHVALPLVFCVVICRSLFVLLSIFFWPLCRLSFDLWLLITSLVVSVFFRYLLTRTCRKRRYMTDV